MNVEYSMPSEWGYLISRRSVIVGAAVGRRSPWPTVSVAHSPTPSAVRIAARRVGAVRKAAAACEWWWPVNRIFAPRHAEVRRDDAAHPDLFAERVLDRVGKGPPGVGKRPQRAGQDPIELPHAALVEDDGVEIGRIEPGVIQAPFDGRQRKAGVVLAPRQALFLHGADRHAVDDERGGRVVVVRGDAEDLHLQYWLVGESLALSRDRSPADRLAASRRVWPTRQTARAPRNT